MATAAPDQEKTGLGNYFIVSRTNKSFSFTPLISGNCVLEPLAWVA